MKQSVSVTAIWTRRKGDYMETLVEIDGVWLHVLREHVGSPFSHIAEAAGATRWTQDERQRKN